MIFKSLLNCFEQSTSTVADRERPGPSARRSERGFSRELGSRARTTATTTLRESQVNDVNENVMRVIYL
jgi:hypothetical protein